MANVCTFYVVVKHHDTGLFSSFHYQIETEILTERDLLKIDEIFADKRNGMIEVKTQTISWQRIDT